jgi:hypothetical protein
MHEKFLLRRVSHTLAAITMALIFRDYLLFAEESQQITLGLTGILSKTRSQFAALSLHDHATTGSCKIENKISTNNSSRSIISLLKCNLCVSLTAPQLPLAPQAGLAVSGAWIRDGDWLAPRTGAPPDRGATQAPAGCDWASPWRSMAWRRALVTASLHSKFHETETCELD